MWDLHEPFESVRSKEQPDLIRALDRFEKDEIPIEGRPFENIGRDMAFLLGS